MAKTPTIIQTGVVSESLGCEKFRVTLESGQVITCHISGKIRQNYIKILKNDKVIVEMNPYDLSIGRISKRLK